MSVQKEAKQLQHIKYSHAIHQALSQTGGNTRDTARHLGVSREWVRRWVKKLNIDIDTYRQPKLYTVILGDKRLGIVKAAGYIKAKQHASSTFNLSDTEAKLVVLVQTEEEPEQE